MPAANHNFSLMSTFIARTKQKVVYNNRRGGSRFIVVSYISLVIKTVYIQPFAKSFDNLVTAFFCFYSIAQNNFRKSMHTGHHDYLGQVLRLVMMIATSGCITKQKLVVKKCNIKVAQSNYNLSNQDWRKNLKGSNFCVSPRLMYLCSTQTL